jgi:hypothetical protein
MIFSNESNVKFISKVVKIIRFYDLKKCGGRKSFLYKNRDVTVKRRNDEEIEKIIYMIYHICA